MKDRKPGVVSVVLVNYKGTDDTLTSIEGLAAQDWPADKLEIIVVDNDSGADHVARLKASSLDFTLVESGGNLGFTGGCNLGVERSSGEIVAFLNNDARPDVSWIRAAMDTFAAGADIGAVASKVLDWEGVNVDFTEAAMTWYGMGYKPHAGGPDTGAWEVEKDVLFGTGAAMFIRADLFDQLGGFDDRYFMFYDDVDLGWRLNLLGWRFRYQPRSVAFHKHHASMNKFGDFRETYLLERNALFTLYKNLGQEQLDKALPGALALVVRRAVGRSELDSTELDLRNPGDDSVETRPVPKKGMAGIYGIDQFVEMLPSLTESRREIQASRVRDDRQLLDLFGNRDEPAYPIESYLAGYDKIVASLDVLEVVKRRRVLIVTGDSIGAKMAGPAIRATNMARELALEHDVRVVSMTRSTSIDDSFEVVTVPHRHPRQMVEHEAWADVIIVQGHALRLFPVLESTRKVLVVDVYDPLHLEQLEQGRSTDVEAWDRQILDAADTLNHQLELGDYFICASERQRLFWLGQLAGSGRVNARTYSRDPELRSLIGVVPFGLSSTPPRHDRAVVKGVLPGIGVDDKLVVWGGGIYDWFDPITLVRAIGELAGRRPEVKLFFMGVQHPNPDVPEMDIVAKVRAVADELGLTGVHVFFNESWIPYDDRGAYLREADAGVSTHYEHLETTFSFRTRILDYLWAELPIVTTDGDSFAELVAKEDLGMVVSERDVDGLANALESVLFDDSARRRHVANVKRVREGFTWENVLAPLVEFVREPVRAADKKGGSGEPDHTALTHAKVQVRNRRKQYGLRHDLGRVYHYYRVEGVGGVVSKVRTRWENR
ncbi:MULTISPECIES: glycosyltransferase [unclassified Frigoribacterium]|uniref:glycosyltransferase n=1 Tax=unclassified Frigoribacterium TaxID=2627005 RepID=UPI0006FC33D6|nr:MULTISPECIES: glycosyltransferase [unclassified Frigoribacterium]KQO46607.1 glycosyl transferase [Frigoribacterium sp. Leaf254]KQT38700.1 glycosyl transferase [Frigoribacterium sp. Leaf415]